MLMEPNEINLTIEKQKQLIEEFAQSNSQTLFVACDQHNIIGFLAGTGGTANRERHSIKIAMGVLAAYWGQSIGMQLLKAMFSWARSHHFYRIELTVMEKNQRALALYKKAGFEVEGLKRYSLQVNNHYVNEFVMAKLIDLSADQY